MDTVMLRSGKVECILGLPVVDGEGKTTGYTGVTTASTSVTGSISGTTLTVTVAGTPGLYPGNIITGAGIPANTYIIKQDSGTTGGVGTYTLNKSTTFASGAITADNKGLPKYKDSPWSTFQAVLQTSSGNGTATVNIYGSNDGVYFTSTPLGTITLSGASGTSDGFTTVAPWKYIRAVPSAVTGTGGTVYVLMGI